MRQKAALNRANKSFDDVAETVNQIRDNISHTHDQLKSISDFGPISNGTGSNIYNQDPDFRRALETLTDACNYIGQSGELKPDSIAVYNRLKERLLAQGNLNGVVDLNAIGNGLATLMEESRQMVSAYLEVLDRDRNRLKGLDERVGKVTERAEVRSGTGLERVTRAIKGAANAYVPNSINRSDANHEISVAAQDVNNNLHDIDMLKRDLANAQGAKMLYADIEQLYSKFLDKGLSRADKNYSLNQFLSGTNSTPTAKMEVGNSVVAYIRKYYAELSNSTEMQELVGRQGVVGEEAKRRNEEVLHVLDEITKNRRCTEEQYEALVRNVYHLWINSNKVITDAQRAELRRDLDNSRNRIDLEALSRKALCIWALESKVVIEAALAPEDWTFLQKYKGVDDIEEYWGRSARWRRIQENLRAYYEKMNKLTKQEGRKALGNRLVPLAVTAVGSSEPATVSSNTTKGAITPVQNGSGSAMPAPATPFITKGDDPEDKPEGAAVSIPVKKPTEEEENENGTSELPPSVPTIK